jgi:hypothetical protein
MKITTTTLNIDIICNVAIILQKTPYTYTDKAVLFLAGSGKLVIDFELWEMQFVSWDFYDEKIQLYLMGVCHLYQLKIGEYEE